MSSYGFLALDLIPASLGIKYLCGFKVNVSICITISTLCFLNMIVAALLYMDQKVSLILTLPDILAALLYSKVALKAFNEE